MRKNFFHFFVTFFETFLTLFSYPATNGCAGADTIVIDIASGVNELSNSENIKIYPNPNTGQFTLEFNLQNNTHLSVYLYQIDGRLIYTKDLLNLEDLANLTIDLSNYYKGMYYVQVVTDENVITRKVIYQ